MDSFFVETIIGPAQISSTSTISNTMDKKTKKRLEVLRQKVEKNQKLLAHAKQQTDEPDEIVNIEKQIAALKAEIAELKK